MVVTGQAEQFGRGLLAEARRRRMTIEETADWVAGGGKWGAVASMFCLDETHGGGCDGRCGLFHRGEA